MRDYNAEHKDVADHKYAYDFDTILRRFMMRAFEPHFSGTRALELGCYEGAFTRLIIDRFATVTVVDASDVLIARASANVSGRARFVHGTFEDVVLDAQFDAVFLIHTLEHIDDPVAVLNRIRGWLAPGGRLFLATPNANAPSRQIAVRMGLLPHNSAVTPAEFKHGHRRTYALDTLESDARAAGLKVIFRGGVMFKPLANFQLDLAYKASIIDDRFFEGCYEFGFAYPDLCASVYLVCTAP